MPKFVHTIRVRCEVGCAHSPCVFGMSWNGEVGPDVDDFRHWPHQSLAIHSEKRSLVKKICLETKRSLNKWSNLILLTGFFLIWLGFHLRTTTPAGDKQVLMNIEFFVAKVGKVGDRLFGTVAAQVVVQQRGRTGHGSGMTNRCLDRLMIPMLVPR